MRQCLLEVLQNHAGPDWQRLDIRASTRFALEDICLYGLHKIADVAEERLNSGL